VSENECSEKTRFVDRNFKRTITEDKKEVHCLHDLRTWLGYKNDITPRDYDMIMIDDSELSKKNKN